MFLVNEKGSWKCLCWLLSSSDRQCSQVHHLLGSSHRLFVLWPTKPKALGLHLSSKLVRMTWWWGRGCNSVPADPGGQSFILGARDLFPWLHWGGRCGAGSQHGRTGSVCPGTGRCPWDGCMEQQSGSEVTWEGTTSQGQHLAPWGLSFRYQHHPNSRRAELESKHQRCCGPATPGKLFLFSLP